MTYGRRAVVAVKNSCVRSGQKASIRQRRFFSNSASVVDVSPQNEFSSAQKNGAYHSSSFNTPGYSRGNGRVSHEGAFSCGNSNQRDDRLQEGNHIAEHHSHIAEHGSFSASTVAGRRTLPDFPPSDAMSLNDAAIAGISTHHDSRIHPATSSTCYPADEASVNELITKGRCIELQEALNSLNNSTVSVATLQSFISHYGETIFHNLLQAYILSGYRYSDLQEIEGLRENLSTTSDSDADGNNTDCGVRKVLHGPMDDFYKEIDRLDKFLMANFGLLVEDIKIDGLGLLLKPNVYDTPQELCCQQQFTIILSSQEQQNKLFVQNIGTKDCTLLEQRAIEVRADGSTARVLDPMKQQYTGEILNESTEHVTSESTTDMDLPMKTVILQAGMKLSRILSPRKNASHTTSTNEVLGLCESDEFPKTITFTSVPQTIRDNLYGPTTRIPVLQKPKRVGSCFEGTTRTQVTETIGEDQIDAAVQDGYSNQPGGVAKDNQARCNSDGSSYPEISTLRRQFVSERSSQIQALHKSREMQDQLSRVDILADTTSCKAIWARWVDELERKIERIRRKHETEAHPEYSPSARLHEIKSEDSVTDIPRIDTTNEVLARVLPNSMPSDLLALITCRTAFATLYEPRREDQNLPNLNGGIAYTRQTAASSAAASISAANAAAGNAARGFGETDNAYAANPSEERQSSFKNVKVMAANDVRLAGDTTAIPFVEMCQKVGDAINFEFNCMEVNSKMEELAETNTALSSPSETLKTKKQYLMKMKLLTEPVWDKLAVRIPLGSALVSLLLESCPVMCDFHDAKHHLSEEQRKKWLANHQRRCVYAAKAGDSSSESDEISTARQNLQYHDMLKSEEDYQKIELNALYHRLIWRNDGKMQGQIVMREICRKVLEEAGFTSMSRPVSPPMFTVPKPWLGPRDGCYLLHPVRLIRNTGSPRTIDDARTYDMTNIQDALNSVGAVPWRINQEIFDIMHTIWENELELGEVPRKQDIPIQPMITTAHEWEELSEEERKQNFLNILNAKKMNTRLVSERPTFLLRMQVAREHYHAEKIYFPHSIDFRGRAYPVPPHLNHQGPDICRGLLEFAEAKVIGERGWYWVRVQLANLFGKDKLSLDDRIKWTDENSEKIRAVGRDPLHPEHREFWSEADDGPWQFLARCIEYDKALSHPDGPEHYATRQTVHMDGSCNGLQHYAALGRDPDGGRAVNVLPNKSPADVYSIVLEVVRGKVEASAEMGDTLAQQCIDLGTLKRSTVKQTVMTICYGVTAIGAQRQVTKHLEDLLGTTCDASTIKQMGSYIAKLTLKSVDEVFERAMGIKRWFDVASGVFSDCNVPVSWMTPLGLAVTQPYYGETGKSVKTCLQSVQLRIKNADGKVDGRQQKCGFPPNFVHSLDACHMMMVALQMQYEGRRYAAVHDSFWTHPSDVDRMNEIIRETFIELHSAPILENLESDFRLLLGNENQQKLPALPSKSNMDITQVRKSLYFFD